MTQYEFARAGIVTEEMIFVAARENLGREHMCADAAGATCRWREFWRRDPFLRDAGIRPRRNCAGPRDHPRQHQSSGIGADDHRPQFPRQGECQYRQFGGDLFRRRGSRENGLGDPLGCRHRHGPLDRAQYPQYPRLDHAQFAGADRHGADLPGARKSRRRSRKT